MQTNELEFPTFISNTILAARNTLEQTHTSLSPNVLHAIQAQAVLYLKLCLCIFCFKQGPDGVAGEDGLAGPRVSVKMLL